MRQLVAEVDHGLSYRQDLPGEIEFRASVPGRFKDYALALQCIWRKLIYLTSYCEDVQQDLQAS